MKYALGNMLNGAGGLNADQLALDLQFAADKTLTARKGPTPTFTRASSGTFVGSNGLIQSAATNVARFDHDPVTLASRGLLIEESRTNASWYSGALLFGTGWGGTATSASSVTGPDNNTAYQISETTITQAQSFGNTGGSGSSGATSVVSGTVYTGSIFLKKVAGSVDWVQITLGSGGFGSTQYANFNIGNGTVGNSAGLAIGTSPRIEAYSNGWYRCSISVAANATTSTSLNLITGFIQNTNSTTRLPVYAGSTSNQFLAAMCQFEAGSFATSYIPTTTSSVVRSADVCSISGAGFTGMWNASEGSLFTSAIFNAPTTSGVAQMMVDINDGTTANRLRTFRGTTGVMALFQVSGSTSNVEINQTTGVAPFTSQRTSAGFKTNDYIFYVNNTLVGTDAIGAILVSPTTLTIGDASAGALRQYTNGTISSIRYYRKRLANAKLQALTA